MFQGTGNKTTIPNLSQSRLGSIDVPLPPLHEQHEIAGVLRSLRNAIDGSERVVETLTSLKRSHVDEVFRSDGAIGWPRFPCEAVALTITVGVVVRPASHYVPFGVPAFRSLNVREDRLVTKSLVYFDAVASNGILAKSRLRTGDVLVVRTGDPGVSCVVPPEHDGSNCIDIVLVRPDRDQVLPEFLSRFFNSPDARRFVGQAKTGLAQQHLNIGALRKLPVPLPPLGVQHRVVEILSAIDAKVDAERRRLAALEDLYRTLLHGLMTGALRVDDPAVARETAQLSLPAIPVE